MRILIVGTGPSVYHLTRRFLARGHAVTVVDPDPVHALHLSERADATVLSGDGTDPVMLERAGARRADAVLALTGADHDNLAVCQIARRKFGVPRTLSVVNDPDHAEVFRRMGVSFAVSTTELLAQVLHGSAGFEDLETLVLAAGGRIAIAEVALREGAPSVGRLLSEVPLPEGALVGCVIREGGVIVPRGSTLLLPHDRLVIVARPELHTAVLQVLTGGRA